MNDIILENIPFNPEIQPILKKLHIKEGSQDATEFLQLLDHAKAVANPKVLYKLSSIDFREEEKVIIDGVKLTSRILTVNLENTHRVFPFVATCGIELEEFSDRIEDVFLGYWAEAIKELALMFALEAMETQLRKYIPTGHISAMSPGSLEDWPINEQVQLFSILGNTQEKIGVKLTESFLMIPTKSVSGIHFMVDNSFESCQLCPRDNCPNRRAPYNESLYEKKYCPKMN
jgi:hypothetical protein